VSAVDFEEFIVRHVGLFIARVVFGCYLAVHGAQKLFGAFGGRGLEATGAGFDKLGMKPGKLMAAVAGASELGGGLLTATGIADPLGPLMIAGTMAVASTTHRKNGPMSSNGGFELPLTNMAMAVALMSAGTGVLRLGPHLPKSLIRRAVLGGVILAGGSLAQMLIASRKQEQIHLVTSDESTDAASAA
jgi:putative oxidoreductase